MRKKIFCTGPPRAACTDATSPMNQPRKNPIHLYSLSPHSPQFQQSAGATTPLYSLSGKDNVIHRAADVMERGGKGPKEEQVGTFKGREKKRKYPGKVERYSGKEEGEKFRGYRQKEGSEGEILHQQLSVLHLRLFYFFLLTFFILFILYASLTPPSSTPPPPPPQIPDFWKKWREIHTCSMKRNVPRHG